MNEQAADAETEKTPQQVKNDGNNKIQGDIQKKEESNGKVSVDPQTQIGIQDNQTAQQSPNAILHSLNRKVKAQASAFQFIFEVNQQAKNRLKPHELAALTTEERLEQAILTLMKPSEKRSLLDHKLIEETLDQFQYIQKMRKYNSNLSKQVAKVLEHNRTPRGKAVFFAGQQPEYFYMILRGKVAVLVRKSENQLASDKKNGKIVHIGGNNSNLSSPQSNNSSFRRNSCMNDSLNLTQQHSQQSEKLPLSHFATANNAQNGQQQQSQSPQSHQLQSQESLHQSPSHEGLKIIVNQGNSGILAEQTSQDNNSSLDRSGSLNLKHTKPSGIDPILQLNRSRLFTKNLTPKLESSNSNSPNKYIEPICPGISLTPGDLDEPERFFEAGVFAYNYVKDLLPGLAFGEMGLLLKVPRTATILALEDTDLAIMTKQSYQELIKAIENFKFQKKIQFFHSVMHQDLKVHELSRITIDFSQKRKFNKGQCIFQEGDPADVVYIVKKGDIEFYKAFQNDGKTKKVQFSLIGPGEIIGVEELFYSQDERYYNAACMNQVTVYFIKRVIFIRLMHEIPDLKRIMVKRSMNKLKWQQHKIMEVIEQQKLDGLFEKNIAIDIRMPQEDQLCEPIYEKNKKRSKSTHLIRGSQEPKQQEQQIEKSQLGIIQKGQKKLSFYDNKQDQEHNQTSVQLSSKMSSSRSAQDLMIGLTKKKRKIIDNNPSIQQQFPSNSNSIQDNPIIQAYENKEKIMQIIERRSTNVVQNIDDIGLIKSPSHRYILSQQPSKNTLQLPSQTQLIFTKSFSHLPPDNHHRASLASDIGSESEWFDLEKKKQLETQIEHAIKQKQTTLKPSHHKMKQKSHDCLIHASDNKLSADISILPAAMRKKLLYFSSQREQSQFNEYVNQGPDEGDNELSSMSPLSTFKGANLNSNNKNGLCFSIQTMQEQAANSRYFANSLKSTNTFNSNNNNSSTTTNTNDASKQLLPPLTNPQQSFHRLSQLSANNQHLEEPNKTSNPQDFSVHSLSNAVCASPGRKSSQLTENSLTYIPDGGCLPQQSPRKSISSFQYITTNDLALPSSSSPRRSLQPYQFLSNGQSSQTANFHIKRMPVVMSHSEKEQQDNLNPTNNQNLLSVQKLSQHNQNISNIDSTVPSFSDIQLPNEAQLSFSPVSLSHKKRLRNHILPAMHIKTNMKSSQENKDSNQLDTLNGLQGNENSIQIQQLLPNRSTKQSEIGQLLRGSDRLISSGMTSKQSILFTSGTARSLILPGSLSPKKLQKAAEIQQHQQQLLFQQLSKSTSHQTNQAESLTQIPPNSLEDTIISRGKYPASFSTEILSSRPYFPVLNNNKQQVFNNVNTKPISPILKPSSILKTPILLPSPQNNNNDKSISKSNIPANEIAATTSSLLKLVKS